MTTLSQQINVDANDNSGNTSFGLLGATVLIDGFWLATYNTRSFRRYPNTTIPQGSTISACDEQQNAADTDSSATYAVKRGFVDADNQAAPANGTALDALVHTSNTTSESGTNTTAGNWYSQGIATSGQDLVNRAGWASGNACVSLTTNNSGTAFRRWNDYSNSSTLAAKLDWTYTSAVTAALPVGTITATGVLPATRHSAALPIGSATVTGVLPSVRRPADLDTGTITATAVEPTTYFAHAIPVGTITATGVAFTSVHQAALPIGTITATGVAFTATHQTALPSGTITATAVATQSEIQEVYFNGGTAGVLWLSHPLMGIGISADISSALSSWQTQFSSFGTVASITGGLRFTWDSPGYTNTDQEEFGILVDETNGTGVTIATTRNGSDGNALSVTKRTELPIASITVAGNEPTVTRPAALPVGTITASGVSLTVIHQAGLAVGTITVTGVAFTVPTNVFAGPFFEVAWSNWQPGDVAGDQFQPGEVASMNAIVLGRAIVAASFQPGDKAADSYQPGDKAGTNT